MRGEFLNLRMTISGNRYCRALLRPGGVLFDVPPSVVSEARARLEQLKAELEPAARLLLESPSVLGRLEGVGGVSKEKCLELGFVGIVATGCCGSSGGSRVARGVPLCHPERRACHPEERSDEGSCSRMSGTTEQDPSLRSG